MEAIEYMYYGLGQIALAIAIADGKIDAKEIQVLEKRISKIQIKHKYNLGLVKNSFKMISENSILEPTKLIENGIHNFHLGDLYLTDELANLFLEILNDVATAQFSNALEKDKILVSFMSYLKERANLAKFRANGYLKKALIFIDLEEVSIDFITKIDQLEYWLKSGFRITLYHCIAPEKLTKSSFPIQRDEALKKINQLIDSHLGNKKMKDQIEVVVANQRLEYVDQSYLDQHKFDFVIMPTKGKQPGNYYQTTKTSEHIQRHFANYLVIPKKAEITSLSKVLVVTDYHFTSRDQFEPILELCKTTNAKVTLLCIGKAYKLNKTESQKQRALKDYFGEHFERAVFQTINDGVYEDIIKYVNDNNFALLVALPMHSSFYQRFDGHLSIVKKLCQLTPVPLLVINNHPDRLPMEKVINQRVSDTLDF